MLSYIYWTITIILIIYAVYFAVLGLFAFAKDKTKIKKHKPKTKFAVLIAARNEAGVIGGLVESLMNQNYPKELFDVYALANNCTDNTAEVAKKAGAKILDIKVPVKSKGDVLKYAFENLVDSDYDAYLIFDADNVVHPDFMSKMNNVYASGYRVAQGRKDSKNISDNWLSTSYTLFYYTQNFFFNRSRMGLNASATINGTGFMVAKEFVDTHGFNPVTITEDIEVSIMAILNGVQVVYCDDAITYDEQPTLFKSSWNQRERWSKGIMQCCTVYTKKLLSNAFKKHDFASFDKVLFIIAAYVQLISIALYLFLISFNIVHIIQNVSNLGVFIPDVICLFVGYVFTILLNIFILKYYDRNIKENIPGILLFAVFILTWIPINFICLFKKDLKWVQIKHDKNVDVKDLIKK